jgi:hypothetical protein
MLKRGEIQRFFERFDRPARPRFAPDLGAGRLPDKAIFACDSVLKIAFMAGWPEVPILSHLAST